MADIGVLLPLCSSQDITKRTEAYHALTDKLSTLPQSSEWGEDVTEESARNIISNLKQDLYADEVNTCYEAVGFLGCYLANEKLMDLLTVEDEHEVLLSLMKLCADPKDKTVLSRCLWSLAQSKFECEIYSKHLTELLQLIIDTILVCNPPSIVVYECMQVMKSLVESIPKEVLEQSEHWFGKVFLYLFDDVLKIRGVTWAFLNICNLFNQQQNSIYPLHQYIKPFVNALTEKYLKEMTSLVEENCCFVMGIWRLLIVLLGDELHTGTKLINGCLEVVEKAFKSPRLEFRTDALKCWHTLISNFASNPTVLHHPKRVKLLVAPLKSNNAKTEDVAQAKLVTWWFLVIKLEDKITNYFDLVVVPLLKFCFNPTRIIHFGLNERMLLLSGGSSPCTKYQSLILKACDVLACILSSGEASSAEYNYSVSVVSCPILNTSLFNKNHQLILGCVADALLSLNPCDKRHLDIALIILKSTMKLVKASIEQNNYKKDATDLVNELFNVYGFLESQSKPGDLSNLFCFEFLRVVTVGDSAFEANVLHSRNFAISSGLMKLRDVMNGTLSNYLIHKLYKPQILHFATSDSRFLEMFLAVIDKSKPASKLVFVEAVMEELKHSFPFLCPDNSKTFLSLWTHATKRLCAYIEETQEINQGDNSEHDWTAVYNTLLLPFNCSEESLRNIVYGSSAYQDMLSAWSNLWNSFTSLTPLAVSAKPNMESEFIANNILSVTKETAMHSPDAVGFTYTFFADILHIIVEKFRFRELGKNPKKYIQSPFKPRGKVSPLCNLASLAEVLTLLMDKTLQMVSHWRLNTMKKISLSFTKIFTNVFQDKVALVLIEQQSQVLTTALKINPAAKFTTEVERAFISMWNAFCGLIECRIGPNLERSALATLSPLFVIALKSSHSDLRQRMRLLWSTSFASTSVAIPKELFDVLKSEGLPPASISELPSGEAQSLSPKENIPTHISGSFLNREKNKEFLLIASPKLTFKEGSPLSTARKTPTVKPTIDELRAEDFVKVSSPKVSKRVLTTHQAEKMRERATDIPALYNDMSQSFSQLPSQFITQDSFDSQQEPSEKKGSADIIIKSKINKGKNLDFNSALLSISRESQRCDRDSHNKSYSEEELDDVLRDASVEMEKSFSDSVILLNSSKEGNADDQNIRKSRRPKSLVTYTNSGIIVNDKDSAAESLKSPSDFSPNDSNGSNLASRKLHSLKRKMLTPKKRSLLDVQKALRGTPNLSTNSNSSKTRYTGDSLSPSGSERLIDSSDNENSSKKLPHIASVSSSSKLPSYLKSPLSKALKNKDVSGTYKSPPRNLSSPKKYVTASSNVSAGSEDEIPNSQMDPTATSTSLLNPFVSPQILKNMVERTRRSKRKSIFENDTIYITPPKRRKPVEYHIREEKINSPNESVVILSDSEQISQDSPSSERIEPNSDKKHLHPKFRESICKSNADEVFFDNELEKHYSQKDSENVNNQKLVQDETGLLSKKYNKTKRKDKEANDSTSSTFHCDQKVKQIKTSTLEERSTPNKGEMSTSSDLSTPPKVTRSGRRIVAPNKDMPEPMTPPGYASKKSLSVESAESSTKPSSREEESPVPKLSPSPKSSPRKDDSFSLQSCLRYDEFPSPKSSPRKESQSPYSNSSPVKENLLYKSSPVKECTVVCEELKAPNEGNIDKVTIDKKDSQKDKQDSPKDKMDSPKNKEFLPDAQGSAENKHDFSKYDEDSSKDKIHSPKNEQHALGERDDVPKGEQDSLKEKIDSRKDTDSLKGKNDSSTDALIKFGDESTVELFDLKNKSELVKAKKGKLKEGKNILSSLRSQSTKINLRRKMSLSTHSLKDGNNTCNKDTSENTCNKDTNISHNKNSEEMDTNAVTADNSHINEKNNLYTGCDNVKPESTIGSLKENTCLIVKSLESRTSPSNSISHYSLNNSNQSKYKVIFSPKSIRNKKVYGQTEISVDSGIIFSRSLQKSMEGSSEHITPPKPTSPMATSSSFKESPPKSPLKIPHIIKNKRDSLSDGLDTSQKSDTEPPHSGTALSPMFSVPVVNCSSPKSVTKVSISDVDCFNSSNSSKLETNPRLRKESDKKEKGIQQCSMTPIRLFSTKDVTLSPIKNGKSPKEIKNKPSPHTSFEKLTHSNSSCSESNFRLHLDQSVSPAENKPSFAKSKSFDSYISPERSPSSKRIASDSHQVLKLSKKSDHEIANKILGLSSSPGKTKNILFISSPKSPNSSIIKLVYSPHDMKSIDASGGKESNQVIMFSKDRIDEKDSSQDDANVVCLSNNLDPESNEVGENENNESEKSAENFSTVEKEDEDEGKKENLNGFLKITDKAKIIDKCRDSTDVSHRKQKESSTDEIENAPKVNKKIAGKSLSPLTNRSKPRLKISKERTIRKPVRPMKKIKMLKKRNKPIKKRQTRKKQKISQPEDSVDNSDSEIQIQIETEKNGEKTSPDKDNSKLSHSVSTPERKKFSMMKVKIPGSRAAIMLACAKRTMQTRVDENVEQVLNEDSREQTRIKTGGRLTEGTAVLLYSGLSPGCTPKRKRPFSDVYHDGKPWARHEPSPGASPCGSILKKRQVEDENLASIIGDLSELVEGSPSTSKNRRVSFADPPVSESVEIPASPKVTKCHKAQKRLDMTQVVNSTENLINEVVKESTDTESVANEPSELLCQTQTIYPPLVTCSDPVDNLTPFLTSSLIETIKAGFKLKKIKTVGDFCSLTEEDLKSFPIRSPEFLNAIESLRNYADKKQFRGDDKLPSISTEVSSDAAAKATDDAISYGNPPKKHKLTTPETLNRSFFIDYGPDSDSDFNQTDKLAGPEGREEAETEEESFVNQRVSDSSTDGKNTWKRIKEVDVPIIFCEQMEKDSSSISTFIGGLSQDTRLKIFKSLTDIIPYRNIIDMFHEYLLSQNGT